MKTFNFSLQLISISYLLWFINPSMSPISNSSEVKANQVEKWQSLFNHKNLHGWHALPGGEWKVENGIIVGTSRADEPLHGILVSNKIYSDFKLKVTYKAIKGNSGVYFRVEKVNDPVHVYGFQVEIDPERDAGGLYETGNRGWVAQPTPKDVKKWYKPNEWNEMVIIAKGKDVVVYINGYKTAELNNDPGRTKGYIGLQLHGNAEMNVMFKDILLIKNPKDMKL
jgi:hypothetical protein